MTQLNGIFLISILVLCSCGFQPPGTAILKDTNKYLDRTEVTNIDWMEFLWWIEQDYGRDSDQYREALPDSSLWLESYNPPFMFNLEYYYFPVTGVTYEQAHAYCQWRGTPVSMKYNRPVTYMLPSAEHYQKAYNTHSRTKNIDKLHEVKKLSRFQRLFNRKHYGIGYNAAEMTSEKYEAIPVNNDLSEEFHTTIYRGAENNLGFRCIAVINED